MNNWIVGDSLTFMQLKDSNSVDLVLADPPYSEFPLINDSIREARRISRGASVYFMYAEDLVSLNQTPDQVLFWVKPISTKNTIRKFSRFVEVIAVYDLDRVHLNQDLYWQNRSGIFTDTLHEKPIHPFQKPFSLIERLVKVFIPTPSVVLDPFAGSGTVHNVCKSLGIESISIELDPVWRKNESN